VTSGASAEKSTTNPSAASVRPSPASSTPAFIIDSLYLPIASMICSNGMFLYASTPESSARMISMNFMIFSLVRGSFSTLSLRRRTGKGRIDILGKNF
jgi:hypothetical protein